MINIDCTGTMLEENGILTSLDLGCCGLGPVGLCEVCNALKVNTTLTSLDLSMNMFDDKSIASLGKLLMYPAVMHVAQCSVVMVREMCFHSVLCGHQKKGTISCMESSWTNHI